MLCYVREWLITRELKQSEIKLLRIYCYWTLLQSVGYCVIFVSDPTPEVTLTIWRRRSHAPEMTFMQRCSTSMSCSPDVQLHQATFLTDSCTTVVAFFERSLSLSITLYCVIYTGISLYTVSYSNHHLKSNVFLEYSVSDALTERFPSTFNTVRISLNIHACKRSKRFSHEPNTV